MTTTGSVLSPEVKLMSKPRPTSSSSNTKPNGSQEAFPMMGSMQQPGKEPVIMNRRSSWSNPPRVLKQQDSTSKGNKLPDSSVIDSALLAALRDPRERIGLLRLEQTLIDFVMKQPQDPHMDVGGPYNSIVKSPTLGYISPGSVSNTNKSQTSFQRCILHRLADRFEITRDNNMDGTIRLLKQTQTKVPSRLLLDVKPEEYSLVQSMEQVSLNNNSTNNTTGGNGSQGSNNKPPTFGGAVSGSTKQPKISSRRNSNEMSASAAAAGSKKNGSDKSATSKSSKMKIMKRANSCPVPGDAMHRTNSNASLKKKNSSLTDREKAYAEARARIFQQEQEASDAAAANAANNTAAPDDAAPSSSSSSLAPTASSFEPSSSTTTAAPTTATTTNTKATFRDRNQDVIDPDFRRGHAAAAAASSAVGLDHYSNPTNDYYGYYSAPQHYPRNHHHHYGAAVAQQGQQQQQQSLQQTAHAWVPSGTTSDKTQAQAYAHHYPPYPSYSAASVQQIQQQPQPQYAHVVAQATSNQHLNSTTTAAATTVANMVANSDSVGG